MLTPLFCSALLINLFFTQLRFPLDLIKVTEGTPLFSADESAKVILRAEEEGVDRNEYKSGKFRLGGKY